MRGRSREGETDRDFGYTEGEDGKDYFFHADDLEEVWNSTSSEAGARVRSQPV